MSKPTTMKQLMETIRRENPAYWPHGLKEELFDVVYPIEHAGQLVGFTAWQFRVGDDNKHVGYYAVGVLPEHRRKGLAEKALKSMIAEKPKHVEEVRAYIVASNKPSLRLAEKLKVPVQHKSASLHDYQPPVKVARMPLDLAISPNHTGLSLQSFMPVSPRRQRFSKDEERQMQEGREQWFPRVFDSLADSPAVDMSSPGKGAIMSGVAGGAAGAALLRSLTDSTAGTVAGGGVGALLGALATYFSRDANNTDIEERMRRIPQDGTRRDVLADPILQAQLNRDTTMRAALAQSGVKFSGILDRIGGFLKTPTGAATAGAALGVPAYDAISHPEHPWFFDDPYMKSRAHQMLLNSVIVGGAGALGSRAAGKAPTLPKSGIKTAPYLAKLQAHNAAGVTGALSGQLGSVPGLVVKDLALANMNTGHALADAAQGIAKGVNTQAPATPSSLQQLGDLVSKHPGLAAALGLGAGGLAVGAGMLANRGIEALRRIGDKDDKGRIRVTLPTRKPGDAETTLDLPIKDIPLSNAMFGRLRRDFRNRVHTETKERTRHVTLSDEEKQRRGALLNQYRHA